MLTALKLMKALIPMRRAGQARYLEVRNVKFSYPGVHPSPQVMRTYLLRVTITAPARSMLNAENASVHRELGPPFYPDMKFTMPLNSPVPPVVHVLGKVSLTSRFLSLGSSALDIIGLLGLCDELRVSEAAKWMVEV